LAPHSKNKTFFYSAWQGQKGPNLCAGHRQSVFGFYSRAVYTQQALLRSGSAILSPDPSNPLTINGVKD